MEFGAGAAGACLTHHPEVIFPVAGNDVDGGIEPLRAEQLRPEGVCLLVKGSGVAGCGAVNRGIETLRRELPTLNEQFPGPGDRLLLEVIAKGPISQHLEEGVVVSVEPDILEVVMLAAGADALLGVGCAGGGVGAWGRAEKNRDELIHPCVCKEQVRGIGQQTRGRDDAVLLAAEKIEEGGADLGGGHGARKDEG